jgi:hypothetical protein
LIAGVERWFERVPLWPGANIPVFAHFYGYLYLNEDAQLRREYPESFSEFVALASVDYCA